MDDFGAPMLLCFFVLLVYAAPCPSMGNTIRVPKFRDFSIR